VYDVGRHEDSAFVVMEFLEGETLRARMRGGPIPLRKALEYAIQMAHALGAAHARGVVHRDLKPENIFITSDGRLKVLDFGLAQLASASAAAAAETVVLTANRPTTAGTIVGTVGYMAPEQARGHPVDARADIFSFGAVLYEMISGRRAFTGDTAVDVLAAVLHTDPPELTFDPRIPPTLDRIVRRCLEKRPEERFQSASDVAFALDAVASGSNSGRMAVPDAGAPGRRCRSRSRSASSPDISCSSRARPGRATARSASRSMPIAVLSRRSRYRPTAGISRGRRWPTADNPEACGCEDWTRPSRISCATRPPRARRSGHPMGVRSSCRMSRV
jgi:serine/threonine protein kinase